MTKILLVEDDKSLREIYGVRLLAEGYDIISAGDGEEALAMAIKDQPALIVSDVMMPKISGFDMLDILRSTTETRGIKVIMMTALSSEDQRQRGESLGADRYLVKSQVGIEDVVRAVHDVLSDAPQQGASSTATQAQAAPTQPQQPTPAPAQQRPTANESQPSVSVPPRPAQTAPETTQPAPQQTEQPAAQQPTPPVQPTSQASPTEQSEQQSPAAQQEQQPAQNPFPQPTAPFSTQRPANLGDRVIQPLARDESSAMSEQDLAKRMEQELNAALQSQDTAPAQNTAQPAERAEQPAPQQTEQPATQQPTPPVQPAQNPQQAAPSEPSGLNFEETPRSTTSTPGQQ